MGNMRQEDGLIMVILLAILGLVLNILRFVFGVTTITDPDIPGGLIIYYITTGMLIITLMVILPSIIKRIISIVRK